MVRVYIAEISDAGYGHRHQSEQVRLLLNRALQKEHPGIRTPVLIERDENGKPFLPEHPGIFVNLSHSGSYLACAVGERPVGVDVEERKSRRNVEQLARKFHPLESELVLQAGEEERNKLFYDIWVLKESFMKATGRGLRISLDSFCCLPGQDRVEQDWSETVYYCRSFELEGCSLAACSEEKDFAREICRLELEN